MINLGLNLTNFLAQVTFGSNSASILGIFLSVAGLALFFIRFVNPDLTRAHDTLLTAAWLLCGFILIFQGWRLDPILQFGQLLLVVVITFYTVESIRLRQVNR